MSDAPGDAGEIVDDVIEVRLGSMGVGRRIEVQFDVLPTSGTVATNRASSATTAASRSRTTTATSRTARTPP